MMAASDSQEDHMDSTLAIIEANAEVVMEGTDDPERRNEWLAARRKGIGGSDVAAVAGLSPYQSPFDVWCTKVDDYSRPENERMRWGKRLERAIGYGIAEDVGLAVAPFPHMLRSRTFPTALANLDLIGEDESVVEVKNASWRFGEDWEDGKAPDHYVLQAHHEILASGLKRTHLFALIDGGEGRHVTIERDEALLADLRSIEERFWKLVEENTPPAIDHTEATTEALKARYPTATPGSQLVLPMTTLESIGRLKMLQAQMKQCEREIDGIKNELRAMLGDHEAGICDGIVVVTYKNRDGYTRPAVDIAPGRVMNFPKSTTKGKPPTKVHR